MGDTGFEPGKTHNIPNTEQAHLMHNTPTPPSVEQSQAYNTATNQKQNKDTLNSVPCGAGVAQVTFALPSDLQAVIDAWPALPDALKAGIIAMVNAARK